MCLLLLLRVFCRTMLIITNGLYGSITTGSGTRRMTQGYGSDTTVTDGGSHHTATTATCRQYVLHHFWILSF